MIDHEDSDGFIFASMISESPILVTVLIILAIVFAVIAYRNEDECKKMKCTDGSTPVLMDHGCKCVQNAH